MRGRLLFAAVSLLAACTAPDEPVTALHLEVVRAPAEATPGTLDRFPLLVKVVDGSGDGVAGIRVSWSVRSGGGQLTASADTSGVDGLASALWAPGLAVGTQQVAVTIYDQPALVITVPTEAFRADKIVTGFRSGCGLRDAAVWCWDYGPWGEKASITRTMSGVRAAGMAMNGSYLCILDVAGAVHCQRWYENPNPDESAQVTGLPPMSAISGGQNGPFCGIAKADGTPWCWPRNEWNATQASSTLQLVRISAGGSGACGLAADGAAWCWDFPSATPVALAGGHSFREISVGLFTSCGIEAPTRLYCWDSTDLPPVPMTGIDAAQVYIGWSRNIFNGSSGATAFYALPNQVPQYYTFATFPLPVRQVSAGDDTPCVIAYDDSVYCLGSRDNIDLRPTWLAVLPPGE